MGWLVKCLDPLCKKQTWATNIVNLINVHTNHEGWLECPCGKGGYIEKGFDLQEPGQRWEPILKGVIRLAEPSHTYQPFVFLVSKRPDQPVTDIWFSYYKDLRPQGRLKLGYGPGGPPVLATGGLLQLLKKLVDINVIPRGEVRRILDV